MGKGGRAGKGVEEEVEEGEGGGSTYSLTRGGRVPLASLPPENTESCKRPLCGFGDLNAFRGGLGTM